MHNSGTSGTLLPWYGTYLIDLYQADVKHIKCEESIMSKLEKRLKVVEKEMIKFPRRMDLKLEAIQLRKDIKAIKIKEKK